MTECELINQSILIVQAEFIGTTELHLSDNNMVINPGVLRITERYKGDNTPNVILVDQPKVSGLVSSSDLFFKQGQTGIWFLTKGVHSASDIYYANNPQRFWQENKSSELKKLLTTCSTIK